MQVIEDFTSVGTGKVVRNSSITVRDAKNTVAIYGEDVGSRSRKTVRKKPQIIVTDIRIQVGTIP